MRREKNIFILFINSLNKFLKETVGGTQIEYALVASLVSLAIFAAAQELGSSLNTAYDGFATTVANVAPSP